MTASTVAIVLAAGKGTRMKSDLPKVLFEACGRPLIEYVIDALERAGVDRMIVVIGYRAADVRQRLAHRRGVEFVEQTEQLGTGHAVMVCREQLEGHDGPVVILAGDSPLTQSATLRELLDEYQQAKPACILGTLHKENPTGMGRIVRDAQGKFLKIVEQKDATEEEQKVTEVNMSTYVFDCRELLHALSRIDNRNRQGEYYVTDCPGILQREGKDVRALPVLRPCEALSVNTIDELHQVEAEMRKMGCV
jgi:bifunctional UDP-N-acetylglucosamine pyrophosphorylase/glucosamine-1-phosphate N-acetyltransferase/UDP-N-acetylglucosamine pyrophosphorylase